MTVTTEIYVVASLRWNMKLARSPISALNINLSNVIIWKKLYSLTAHKFKRKLDPYTVREVFSNLKAALDVKCRLLFFRCCVCIDCHRTVLTIGLFEFVSDGLIFLLTEKTQRHWGTSSAYYYSRHYVTTVWIFKRILCVYVRKCGDHILHKIAFQSKGCHPR